MTRSQIYVGVAVIVLFLVLTEPEIMKALSPRGIRLNNAGNIKKNAIAWEGLSPKSEQTDPTFFKFVTPFYGLRALAVLLYNYRAMYNLSTVRALRVHYLGMDKAGVNENTLQDLLDSIDTIGGVMGCGIDATIDARRKDTLWLLLKGFTVAENGKKLGVDYYSDAEYQSAANAALASRGAS